MARAGITKYSVEKARNTLISNGVNPSIDAIRVELGNTGSKTTISRYLKEIEAEESVQLEDEALLSEGIKEIIAKLASKLHHEAKELVDKSETRFKETVDNLEANSRVLTNQLNEQTTQLEESDSLNNQLSVSNQSLQNEIEALRAKINDSNSRNKELTSVLQEKGEQIDTLKESHQHARESLGHYRESVKEQREQELRQHEQRVQQLQGEIRQLNQTLIVKQTDITNLNKDNSRLITELGNQQKSCLNLESKISQYIQELNIANEKKQSLLLSIQNNESTLAQLKSEKLQLSKENEVHQRKVEEMNSALVRLEVELKIKNELLEKIDNNKVES